MLDITLIIGLIGLALSYWWARTAMLVYEAKTKNLVSPIIRWAFFLPKPVTPNAVPDNRDFPDLS